MKKISLPLAVIARAVLFSCGHLKPSAKADKISGGIDLAAYTQLDSIHYKGTGYLKHVTLPKNYTLENFVLEPGARNNWHTHPGAEQILYVTDGEGFYQQEGKRNQLIKKGDVVYSARYEALEWCNRQKTAGAYFHFG
ncbi:cupin domain-containing protein [Pedobacter sp. AW1-32]|uniref:cupin domain-containing protein n=1 Tax=Pedobacter sp. AW1-32 TaxID=3383026 RepID=UPI003FF09BE1